MWRSMKYGISCSLLGVLPLAGAVALCYRFPIPFSGYRGGPMAVPMAVLGAAFYVVFGGFAVLVPLGAAVGAGAKFLAGADEVAERRLTLGFALSCDFLAVALLSVLDKIIGSW